MITRYDSESTSPSAINEYDDGAFVRYSDYRTLRDAAIEALAALQAGDNPPQMTHEAFLRKTRNVAIGILKKGLEIE